MMEDKRRSSWIYINKIVTTCKIYESGSEVIEHAKLSSFSFGKDADIGSRIRSKERETIVHLSEDMTGSGVLLILLFILLHRLVEKPLLTSLLIVFYFVY